MQEESSLRYTEIKIPNSGCVVDTNNKMICPKIKAQIFWKIYESAEIRFIKKYLRTDLDVVELGSSLGVVSSHIAKKLNPSCRLFCVEANPDLLDTIRINLGQNAPALQASVIQCAIHYSKDQKRTVHFEIGSTNTTSCVAEKINIDESFSVPTITLSRILKNHKIGKYALVSDIEGAEAALIFNDGKSLEKCEQIIIELHEGITEGKNVSVAMLSEILQHKHGFINRDHYGNVFVFEK